MAVRPQDPVRLAQGLVGPVGVVEGVRQHDAVDRVVLHGQLVRLAEDDRGRRRVVGQRIGDQRGTLGARITQESARLAPQTDLQALLPEDAVQCLFDEPRLLGDQRFAKGRPEPVARGVICPLA